MGRPNQGIVNRIAQERARATRSADLEMVATAPETAGVAPTCRPNQPDRTLPMPSTVEGGLPGGCLARFASGVDGLCDLRGRGRRWSRRARRVGSAQRSRTRRPADDIALAPTRKRGVVPHSDSHVQALPRSSASVTASAPATSTAPLARQASDEVRPGRPCDRRGRPISSASLPPMKPQRSRRCWRRVPTRTSTSPRRGRRG